MPITHKIAAFGGGESRRLGMKFDEVARYAVAMGRACARLAGTEMASLKKVYEVYETTQVYVL